MSDSFDHKLVSAFREQIRISFEKDPLLNLVHRLVDTKTDAELIEYALSLPKKVLESFEACKVEATRVIGFNIDLFVQPPRQLELYEIFRRIIMDWIDRTNHA